jgi:hypothetical protein
MLLMQPQPLCQRTWREKAILLGLNMMSWDHSSKTLFRKRIITASYLSTRILKETGKAVFLSIKPQHPEDTQAIMILREEIVIKHQRRTHVINENAMSNCSPRSLYGSEFTFLSILSTSLVLLLTTSHPQRAHERSSETAPMPY